MVEERTEQVRVAIVAIPDAVISTLSGIYDVFNGLALLAGQGGSPTARPSTSRSSERRPPRSRWRAGSPYRRTGPPRPPRAISS